MPNVYPPVAGVELKGQQPHAAPTADWAAIAAQLPNLSGERLLVLGCGDGWLCRTAVVAGALTVQGVDASSPAIMSARKMASSSRLRYRLMPESRWSIIGGQYTLILVTAVKPSNIDQLSRLPRLFRHGHGSIILCGDASSIGQLTEAIYDADRRPGSWREAEAKPLPSGAAMHVLTRSRIGSQRLHD
ncbi:class I SAM-dependent methyltransferase [Lacticaseibacillus zhaodongensis]|uniref:class I SAM-dependent methyltransferase n=1 Tax=Lacticaseibacillus zhaodongensis TaxID=2668065 RepID=UPI0012D33690|nr:hypothetical protein [Lacticaseibacillus zhaodongensis]